MCVFSYRSSLFVSLNSWETEVLSAASKLVCLAFFLNKNWETEVRALELPDPLLGRRPEPDGGGLRGAVLPLPAGVRVEPERPGLDRRPGAPVQRVSGRHRARPGLEREPDGRPGGGREGERGGRGLSVEVSMHFLRFPLL